MLSQSISHRPREHVLPSPRRVATPFTFRACPRRWFFSSRRRERRAVPSGTAALVSVVALRRLRSRSARAPAVALVPGVGFAALVLDSPRAPPPLWARQRGAFALHRLIVGSAPPLVRRRTAYTFNRSVFRLTTRAASIKMLFSHKCVHQSRSGVVVQLSSHSFIVGLATHAAGAASYCERPSTVQCSDPPRAPYQSRCCDTQVCASIKKRRRSAIVVPLLHCRPRYARRRCGVVLRTTFNRSVFRLTTRAASIKMLFSHECVHQSRSGVVVQLSSHSFIVGLATHAAGAASYCVRPSTVRCSD